MLLVRGRALARLSNPRERQFSRVLYIELRAKGCLRVSNYTNISWYFQVTSHILDVLYCDVRMYASLANLCGCIHLFALDQPPR